MFPMLLALVTSAMAQDYPAMVNGNGVAIHWYSFPVEYVVNGGEGGIDTDGMVYAAVSAGSAWNRVAGAAVEMAFTGTTDLAVTEADSFNVIHVPETWDWSADLIALTSLWSRSDGTAVGFDMELNVVDHPWATDGSGDAVDAQNTFAHEFGHALGIGHIAYDDDATMYPSASHGETSKRDLDRTDEDVLIHFYPDGTAASETEGQLVDPLAACSGSAAPPILAATMMAFALVARRRSTPLAAAPARAR